MTVVLPDCIDPEAPCLWDNLAGGCPCEDDTDPTPVRPVEDVPTGSYL